MDVSKKGIDPEYKGESTEKKRMKLPVYHSPKEDGTVTIRLSIKPRVVERSFFIMVIIVLLSVIFFKPAFIFGPVSAAEEQKAAEIQQPIALQPETAAPTEETVTEPVAEPVDTPVEETPAENVTEEPADEEPAAPTTTQTEIDASRVSMQVTGFTVEQKGPTWYKLKGMEVKVTNNNEIKFQPTVKVWYYDDATEAYFNEESPAKDQQSMSIGVDPGSSRTFSMTLDESFSGSDLNPTVLIKLYDLKTNKFLKQITEVVEFDE